MHTFATHGYETHTLAQNSQIDKFSNMSLQPESFLRSMSSSCKSSRTFSIWIENGFLTSSKSALHISGKYLKNSFLRLVRWARISDDKFRLKLPSTKEESASNIAKFPFATFCCQLSSFCTKAFQASMKSSTVVSFLCILRFKQFSWPKISTKYDN